MSYPLTIVDVEATGFIEPAPIEIAALRLTPAWTIERAFYRRWHPAKDVEPDAARKNGYNAHDWQGCEPITTDDLVEFSAFVEGSQWAGSFPDFDFNALEPNRIGARLKPWPLATHRKPNLGSNGAPLLAAVGVDGGGTGSYPRRACSGRAALPSNTRMARASCPRSHGPAHRDGRCVGRVARASAPVDRSGRILARTTGASLVSDYAVPRASLSSLPAFMGSSARFLDS